MSDKRRDNKGRILQPGERQRNDGMYEYRYADDTGKKHSVYSWKLVQTDKIPDGKRCKESLRDMERKIMQDLGDGIDIAAANEITLNAFFEDYITMKYEIKQTTLSGYKYLYKKHVHNNIGLKKLASITYSDIKRFYVYLLRDVGFKPSSLRKVHAILHPVFETAVRDNIIRQNPTNGVMRELKRGKDWESPMRHALTEQQQEIFVEFCSSSKRHSHWMPLFTLLLGTGCRIGEALGLRWTDCDFEKDLISVNHNLVYARQDDGTSRFCISTPKTRAGVRIIPMFKEVKEALMREFDRQKMCGFYELEIDGYSGFIFINEYGRIFTPQSVNKAIGRICQEYNEREQWDADRSGREPVLLPHFSAHQLRHTFCTRFCEHERDLKIIQEIMGHANITTTMDIYNEVTLDRKVNSFASLSGKIKIS